MVNGICELSSSSGRRCLCRLDTNANQKGMDPCHYSLLEVEY